MLSRKFLCNVNDTRALIGLCLLVTSHLGQILDPRHSQAFIIAHIVIGLSLHIHSFIYLSLNLLVIFGLVSDSIVSLFTYVKSISKHLLLSSHRRTVISEKWYFTSQLLKKRFSDKLCCRWVKCFYLPSNKIHSFFHN